MLPPRFPRQELQRLMNFGALSRGFGTCCLRFKTGVATTPARLASGWLARLYREGVEPSGSLQKVSDRSLILLFWIYPGAREVSFLNLPLTSHHSITPFTSLDHSVGTREQRLVPSASRGICGARTAAAGCCQAPNTSLVPVYDRITFFGNSALRIS